jgi:hypothetical protein
MKNARDGHDPRVIQAIAKRLILRLHYLTGISGKRW